MGGFVSRYIPSRIRKESQSILPPLKKFVFNSAMIQDDGVLAGYIAQSSRTDISAARIALDEFVNTMLKKLASDGNYVIPSVGELRYARTGELVFTAEEGINFLPESFGLSSIHFSLPQREKEHPLVRQAVFRNKEKSGHNGISEVKPLKVRHPAARRIAVAIPLLIAISLLPLNTRHGLKKIQNNAGFLSMPSLSLNDFNLVIPDEKISGQSVDENSSIALSGEQNAFDRNSYAVIAGSFSTRKNAETLQSTLKEKGFYNEIWEASNGFFRVVVQAHESMSSAQEAVASLRKELQGIEFWILQ
jgi:hypothetical protein